VAFHAILFLAVHGHFEVVPLYLERLEVILHLTRDLGVNLAGVEIILNMRAKMAAMQGQIEEFVQSLNYELANRPREARPEEKNSLIPVVRFMTKITPKTRRGI